MYLKGRIDDEFYDTEYLRLNDLISQNKAYTQPQGNENTNAILTDDWKGIYEKLDSVHKKLFWKKLIKEIRIDKDLNISEIIFL